MLNSGWIKLYRSLLTWEWHDDPACLSVMVHALLLANLEPSKWHGEELERGEFVSSFNSLVEATGLSKQQVRTAVSKLEACGFLTRKQHSKYTVFKVENFSQYQDVNTQATHKQHATNTRIRKKEEKNEKNEEEKKSTITRSEASSMISNYTNNEDLRSALESFVDMRIGLKAPISTSRAMNGLLNKLDSLGMDDTQKIQIVDQSLQSGWKGFYPLKGNKNGRSEKPYQDFSDVIGWGPEGNIDQLIKQSEARRSGEGTPMDTGELPNPESDPWETEFEGWDQLF